MKAYFGNVLSEQYFYKDQRKNKAWYFFKWEVMQNGQLCCKTHFIEWNHETHYTSENNVFFISSASFYRTEDFELTPYQFLAKTYVSSAHASVQIEMANPLDLTRRDRERRRKWQVRN